MRFMGLGYWMKVCLCWALAAFTTATIVVAVQRAQLKDDLRMVQENIEMYEGLKESNIRHRTLRSAPAVTLDDEVINYRLPTVLVPKHYKVYWNPDLETGSFSGQETITVSVLGATNQVILHSHNLTIESIFVRTNSGPLTVINYEFDEVREFIIVNLVNALTVGRDIFVGFTFEGQMKDKLMGLYSSTYLAESGEQINIATTQFEPTSAREAFPCFDEPEMKATFEITVVHPITHHALSNMNRAEEILLGDYKEQIFHTTVAMSTYLVCFIVSDFEYKTAYANTNGVGDSETITMRAFATPDRIDKTDFALEFGVAVVEYYLQYYKVEYPLPKLYMAAIPDFSSNAMENWGLLTYRETALLYDENYSSNYNKQEIARVVAHEIAHQWFGNLVTMKWWNDLWLNEGFARFMEYKGMNAVHEDWGMLDQFLIRALHSVLVFDSKLSSHPIVVEVNSPSDIHAIFDTISYEKGGSVIRMLENLVGSAVFEEAVTNYLTKYQFKNAATEDFLTEVALLVTDFDVLQLMRTWTEQMGYPVVNVQRTSDQVFTVTQQRFLSNKASYEEAPEDSEFGYKWTIPLTYFFDSDSAGEVKRSLFLHSAAQVTLPATSDVNWVKLNYQQVGFYRVNYEESNWKLLTQELINNVNRFTISDRAHLLNDAFALADAGQLSYKIPLEMTSYLSQEVEFVPWYVAAQKLVELQRSLMFSEGYADYLIYARSILSKAYNEVGWTVDADNHLRNRLRVSILSTACALGLPDCLTQAAQRLNAYLQNPTLANKPSPDLREIVYYYGIQQSNSVSTWEQMLSLYQAEGDASEKVKIMYSLTAIQDPQLLYRLLDLAKDESIVRSQDYLTVLQNVAANPIGEPLVWEFYRENWLTLVNRFGLTDRYLGRLIATITKNFASEVKLEEVQQFFNKYPESGAGASSRQQALETIKYNIQWLEDNTDDILSWLSGTASPL